MVLDFVPCHTSTQHSWFREHPDYYVWADAPVNNWRAAFGGSSWGHDEKTGRYFLHSFFPEQADLNWRNPEVREQMTGAMRFWVDRGVDGFRLDALDRLMKDPELRDDPPATRQFELPGDPQDLELDHVHSRNAPDLGDALQAIRRAVGDVLLVGEVYLPIEEAASYLETLDVVFNFEELFAVGDAAKLRAAVEAGMRTGGQGWVLSNHDFSRLVTRAGAANARAVALLLLSLPGPVFLFQGDELGFADAPMSGPEQDRNHRDPFRSPMVWDSAAEHGGFSAGQPWLTPIDAPAPGAVQQQSDPTSPLSLTRGAIALRTRLRDGDSGSCPLQRAPSCCNAVGTLSPSTWATRCRTRRRPASSPSRPAPETAPTSASSRPTAAGSPAPPEAAPHAATSRRPSRPERLPLTSSAHKNLCRGLCFWNQGVGCRRGRRTFGGAVRALGKGGLQAFPLPW